PPRSTLFPYTTLFRSSINDVEARELLRRLALDVVFVIGWSQILGPETLALARVGMIGAHASLLPQNRGSAPINWALIRGECVGRSEEHTSELQSPCNL